jgi:hypothetical protein
MRGRRPWHRGQRGRCFACVDEGRAEGQPRYNLGAITPIDDRRKGVGGWEASRGSLVVVVEAACG